MSFKCLTTTAVHATALPRGRCSSLNRFFKFCKILKVYSTWVVIRIQNLQTNHCRNYRVNRICNCRESSILTNTSFRPQAKYLLTFLLTFYLKVAALTFHLLKAISEPSSPSPKTFSPSLPQAAPV